MSSPILLQNPAIPPGEMVLVTGVNGFMASHIASQLLAAGYVVRGTVRSLQQNSWMKPFFSSKYPNGRFEIVEVPDISISGCFDEAVEGCVGVVHTTSSVELSATNPEPAISANIRTVMRALESAAKEVGVRRFVLTSSFWTASGPRPGEVFTVTGEQWNEQAVMDAYSSDPARSNGFSIFAAGKLKAERACWDFVGREKPGFVFNAVLPDTVFGSILSPGNQGIPSTAGMVKILFDGRDRNIDVLNFVAPQWFIDVTDNARLHVAALLHPDVKGQRLLGAAAAWNWNDVLAILRREFPDKEFIGDMELGRDISIVENGRSVQVLQDVYGQEGWTGLEESIGENVRAFGDPDVKASVFH